MNTKTMFAISALCAAVALTTSAVESSVVGYQTVENTAEDASYIFGASFRGINETGVVPFNALSCAGGFTDDDQIQTAYTDSDGITQLRNYYYFGEWLDEDYNSVSDTDGLPQGGAAWFVSSGDCKNVMTSGEVTAGNYIHTFTETSALITSAFPGAFCPNSANVSWAVSDDTQIQTAYTDSDGITQLRNYYYFGEWLDEDYNSIDADFSVADSGMGFWLILTDASETFSEVSPIVE